jgi:hypothetical protein
MKEIRYRMVKNLKGGPKMKKNLMFAVLTAKAYERGVAVPVCNYQYDHCGGYLLLART